MFVTNVKLLLESTGESAHQALLKGTEGKQSSIVVQKGATLGFLFHKGLRKLGLYILSTNPRIQSKSYYQ
jgi:hypothetical protein